MIPNKMLNIPTIPSGGETERLAACESRLANRACGAAFTHPLMALRRRLNRRKSSPLFVWQQTCRFYKRTDQLTTCGLGNFLREYQEVVRRASRTYLVPILYLVSRHRALETLRSLSCHFHPVAVHAPVPDV